MEAFKEHVGLAAPLNRLNVDTDQIIPKQFLKRIERTGFGQFLFYDWMIPAIRLRAFWSLERTLAAVVHGNTRRGHCNSTGSRRLSHLHLLTSFVTIATKMASYPSLYRTV